MLLYAIRRPLRRPSLPHLAPFHSLPSRPAQALAHPVRTSPSDAALRQIFDTPLSTSPTSTSPTGLFLQPSLTTPAAFPAIADRTILRAQVLVERICTPVSAPESLEGAERAFLVMVKSLDRLSDLLCGVIDLAELVRNVHPEEDWNEGANEAYEELCGYMNVLNTHVGLYEVRLSRYLEVNSLNSSASRPSSPSTHSFPLPPPTNLPNSSPPTRSRSRSYATLRNPESTSPRLNAPNSSTSPLRFSNSAVNSSKTSASRTQA